MKKAMNLTGRLLKMAFLFIIVFSATACMETPKESGTAATAEELGQMNRDFAKALVAKDAAAAASLYDENASLLPPNEPIITGRVNIEAYWQGLIDAGLVDAKVSTIDARSDGDLGYEIGTFELKIQLEDGTIIVETGKYTEILECNENGYWMSLYGMWSSNEPAAQ